MAYFPTQMRDRAGSETEALPQEHRGLKCNEISSRSFQKLDVLCDQSQHRMFGGEWQWAPSKMTGKRCCGEAVGGRAGEMLTASLRAIKAVEVESGAQCLESRVCEDAQICCFLLFKH